MKQQLYRSQPGGHPRQTESEKSSRNGRDVFTVAAVKVAQRGEILGEKIPRDPARCPRREVPSHSGQWKVSWKCNDSHNCLIRERSV